MKDAKDLEQKIKILGDRIEELEANSDVTSSKIAIIDEIFGIFDELPLGHTLINRAINRSKLRYLKQIVLPRRKKHILKIQADDSMPEPVKDILIDESTDLFVKVCNSIKHRESFEKKSADKVQEGFERLHKLLIEKFSNRTKKLVRREEKT